MFLEILAETCGKCRVVRLTVYGLAHFRWVYLTCEFCYGLVSGQWKTGAYQERSPKIEARAWFACSVLLREREHLGSVRLVSLTPNAC
jgi:hypothetical protein